MSTQHEVLAIEVLVIKAIADYLEQDVNLIAPQTLLQDDLGFDSTELIGIIVDLERITGYSLNDIDYAELKTPADLASAIHALLPVNQAA